MIATEDNDQKTAGRRYSPWRLWPVVVISVGFAAFFAFGLDHYLSFEALADNRQELMAWRAENYPLAVVCFVAVYFLTVAFSVPGAMWLSIGGGFLFGAVTSTLYAMVGATLGAMAVFLAARYALGDYLRSKAGPSMRKMEAGFRDNALSYLLVLRLVPLFPFWLVNLVPAFLGVPLRIFAIGTFFGIIPGGFVYAMVGNGLGTLIDAGEMPDLGIIFEPQILGPIVGLAVLSLIPVFYKKYKAAKTREAS